jgi:UDP-glucose 4-epimerase
MKILITGSSGQIGTNLALRCLADGHDVRGLDQRPNPWTNSFASAIVDLARAPVHRSEDLWEAAERPDVLVHLAAHAKVSELVEEPHRAFENIAMLQRVLEACRRWKVPLVFSSSREVYGDLRRPVTGESGADFQLAASTYSASKIACESLIYSYARCYGLSYLVFRLSNVYGRYDNDLERMERVIPLFIRRIEEGEPLTVYGAGKTLDFTHVDDCVAGIAAGLARLSRGRLRNETINLGTGQGHSLLALVDYLAQALQQPPRVVVAEPLPGEITRYVADLGKAKALLDFEPRVHLRDGLRSAIAWGREWARNRPQ